MPLPEPAALDEAAQASIQRFRDHPSGAFALRLYEARAPSSGQLQRPLKVAPARDRR